MKPNVTPFARPEKVDRIYFTDSCGHPVSEEYTRPCPKCRGRCTVHRMLDGTSGREWCHECDYRLEW